MQRDWISDISLLKEQARIALARGSINIWLLTEPQPQSLFAHRMAKSAMVPKKRVE